MRKSSSSSSSPVGRNFVTSLHKGLDVLTCFNNRHPKLTVSEVARRIGVSPASARRSLLTLHELGYLANDGKLFWLLPKVLLVANAYLSSRPLPALAQPLLDSLAERTRESASIAKLMGDCAIIIARSTARRSLTIGLRIGSQLPAYCSATGRVLLAGLPPREAFSLIKRMKLEPRTPRTVTTIDAVVAVVEAARARGYAISDGELELEVRSMAVPIFNRNKETIAALSIAVRANRMGMKEMQDTFIPTLRRAQAQVTEYLLED
jgi:IclR family transcriptional regulator, pca regulon regulatory protein